MPQKAYFQNQLFCKWLLDFLEFDELKKLIFLNKKIKKFFIEFKYYKSRVLSEQQRLIKQRKSIMIFEQLLAD